MRVRRGTITDLEVIVDFTAEEAREAEGRSPERQSLERGIATALENDLVAEYWLLLDDDDTPCGCTSVIREWSDWNAGYYWWIQSMYITPAYRGKGHLGTLLGAVLDAARAENGLELRLYVHKENRNAVHAYEKAGFGESQYLMLSRPI